MLNNGKIRYCANTLLCKIFFLYFIKLISSHNSDIMNIFLKMDYQQHRKSAIDRCHIKHNSIAATSEQTVLIEWKNLSRCFLLIRFKLIRSENVMSSIQKNELTFWIIGFWFEIWLFCSLSRQLKTQMRVKTINYHRIKVYNNFLSYVSFARINAKSSWIFVRKIAWPRFTSHNFENTFAERYVLVLCTCFVQ
jgi:hypothetical protein